MADSHWILKILSGVHLGAEIELEPGTYSLGCHEDCDFVLTDDALQDKQFEIIVTNESIQLKSLIEQPFYVDGQDVGTSYTPELHQILNSHGLSFCIGKPGSQWPTADAKHLVAPSSSSSKPEKSDTKDESLSENQQNAEAVSQHQDERQEIDDSLPIKSHKKEHKMSLMKRFHQLKNSLKIGFFTGTKFSFARYRWAFIVMILLTFLGGIGVGVYRLWVAVSPDSIVKNRASLVEEAKKIARTFYLNDVYFQLVNNHTIVVSGYVKNKSQNNTLMNELKKQEIPVQDRILIISDLITKATHILHQLGYEDYEITPEMDAGSFAISGYAMNHSVFDKIRESLTSEVAGFLELHDNMEYQSTLEQRLQMMLSKANLDKFVTLVSGKNEIELKGQLQNAKQGAHLKEIIQTFRKEYTQPVLKNQITIPSMNMNTLQPRFDIKSISFGRTPYIILGNGEKYLAGTKLENGYILESIGLDYLILRLGNQRIRYNVEEKNG